MSGIKPYLVQIGIGAVIVAVIIWRTLIFDRFRFGGMEVTARASIHLLNEPALPDSPSPSREGRIVIDSGTVLSLQKVVFGRNRAFLKVSTPEGKTGYVVKDEKITVK